MYCPRCGHEIKNNQKFCINCGYELSKDTDNNDNSVYKKSYYKNEPENKNFNIKNSQFEGILKFILNIFCATAGLIILLTGLNFALNNFSTSPMNLDVSKYESYISDPSSIPELTQPESLRDLVKNLKEVQNFLCLYLKYSDDSEETKLKVFENYRKQILKIETFSNENLLKEDIKNSIPQNKKEFKKCAKYYNKLLAPVGFKIVSDTSYGKYHLREDYRFTYKKFATLLSSDIKNYLYLRAKHNDEIMENGGYLAVSPKEMNSRISDYERYLNNNENSVYIKEIQDMLYYYTFAYIFINDRQEMKAIRHKTFRKWDKKFLRHNQYSKLTPIFSKMITSANGISTNQFDNLYPYEYEKNLASICPDNNELEDIFSALRKKLMKNMANVGYKYIYSVKDDIWTSFSENATIDKDSIILADNGQGFDIYNNKFKKTNQTLQIEENTKVIIKNGQLIVYNPRCLQINKIEYSYGNLSLRNMSSKQIRQCFPDVLIINVDNIGTSPVQITKTAISQTYMLISHAGSDFTGYILQSDVPVEKGELSNTFTVNAVTPVNIEWIPSSGDGKQYYITFMTNVEQPQNNSENNSQLAPAEQAEVNQ